jgi:hypothetical protein
MLQVFDAPAEILLREAFAADREPTFNVAMICGC